jgi:hypothetical protein
VPCRFGQGAYAGIFCENIVSAIARDLLAGALQRLEAAGYRVTLHIHDEVVCEMPDGTGSLEEFRSLLTALPAWAEGLPIAAKVREGQRFSKPSKPVKITTAAPVEVKVIATETAAVKPDALDELLGGGGDDDDADRNELERNGDGQDDPGELDQDDGTGEIELEFDDRGVGYLGTVDLAAALGTAGPGRPELPIGGLAVVTAAGDGNRADDHTGGNHDGAGDQVGNQQARPNGGDVPIQPAGNGRDWRTETSNYSDDYSEQNVGKP